MQLKKNQKVAVIGSGPAGLMAASVISKAGFTVHVYEKKPGLGRKILIAGSSGLNVSFDAPLDEFLKNYSGPKAQWSKILNRFPPQEWLRFIHSLGLETFRGTSKRYFVRGMKGSSLLKKWIELLKSRGVEFYLNQECLDFSIQQDQVAVQFADGVQQYSALCFCLGGGSWEGAEKPLRWPAIFQSKKIRFKDFSSANSGFKVDWPQEFLKEAEGLPLKGIVLTTSKGSRAGELVVTQYGLEGTPIYALGEVGPARLDLKPSLTENQIFQQLSAFKENLSPIRRVKKSLGLSPAALGLIFHLSSPEVLKDLRKLIQQIKNFPILLKARQPLEESISSSGGLAWDELDENLMLKKFPGVFAAGEMLDWDAPTGGFLIQGCVSQGCLVGNSIIHFIS